MSTVTLMEAKTMQKVGLADFKVSHDAGVILSSLPLGACLGVVIYEPSMKVGGLLHSLLPSSAMDPARAVKSPGMYLDAGLAAMLKRAQELHVKVENLQVFVIGGAQVLDDSSFFNFGRRHYEVLTTVLKEMNLSIEAEEVGGQNNRSVQLDLETGEVGIKTSGQSEIKTLCKK